MSVELSHQNEALQPAEPNLIESLYDKALALQAKLGRIAATGLAIVAGAAFTAVTVEEGVHPEVASADTLGYPWYDATYVDANYDWGYSTCPSSDTGCMSPFSGWLNGVRYGESDPWAYYLRNCTSYVAWKLNSIGVPASQFEGLGNGGDWYNDAPSGERSSTPAAWDAAVVPGTQSNPFGHVAFVESVNTDGTITVSEYNHDAQGHGDTRTGTAASMGFTEFVDFGVHPTNSPNGTPQPGPTFTPAIIQRPSGETDVAVVGPANSLVFYYNAQGSQTWGKITVPGAQAYSSPAIVQRSSGETDIAVEGPNNSLDFYYNAQGSQNWGEVTVAGAGTTYSTPAVIQRPSGETDIAVEGPNNTLSFYYNAQGSQNWGGGPISGSHAGSEPAIVQRSTGETDIAVTNPDNSLDFYYNAAGSGSWGVSHVAVTGWAYSAPSMVQRPTTGETDIAVQGPNNELDFYINSAGSGAWGRISAAGTNTTYNAPNPPAMLQRSTGETDIAVQGPGNQADFYFNAQGSQGWGESIAAVEDYSFRAPVMVQRPSGNSAAGETDMVIHGPNNRLDFYFNAPGSPYWSNLPIDGNNSAS